MNLKLENPIWTEYWDPRDDALSLLLTGPSCRSPPLSMVEATPPVFGQESLAVAISMTFIFHTCMVIPNFHFTDVPN